MDQAKISQVLTRVPVLAKLPSSSIKSLASGAETQAFNSNDIVIKQGDAGNGFFVIASGTVQVTANNGGKISVLGDLGPGDFFGETALLNPEKKRGATVTASSKASCLFIAKSLFDKVIKAQGVKFAKRNAITSDVHGMSQLAKRPLNAQSPAAEDVKMILGAVEDNVLFKELDANVKEAVANEMYRVDFKKGDVAINQGDLGDLFYVIGSGKFAIIVNGLKVSTFSDGMCFGELALMYNAKRAATVKALGNAWCWAVDRYTYRRLVILGTNSKMDTYVSFLNSVELLSPLAQYEREKVAEALEEVTLKKGKTLFKQGDEGEDMYIVREGKVRVTQLNPGAKLNSEQKELCVLGVGQYFGERALLKNDTRAASVSAITDTVLLRLDRTAFTLLLGPLEDIMMAKIETYETMGATGEFTGKIEKKDLDVVTLLGKGSYGYVRLVKHRQTGQIFALKSVNKQLVVATGQKEHLMSEKSTMARFDHPFLIKLHATYKDKDRLYFLLEACMGGELFTVLRQRKTFNVSQARFFAAQVTLCFEYMHSLDIIYRDLKPENLLLDPQGYLKITDFGFAKDVKPTKGRTFTLCGTPDYLAPEIVAGKGHGKGVDWWCLGIFLFEMLTSEPPFYNEDQIQTYQSIMRGKVNYPKTMPKDAKNLIMKLLAHSPTKRLGVTRGGARLIKKHKFFNGFDWEACIKKTIPAPFIPTIKNQLDIGNFDVVPEDDQEVVEPYRDDGTNWEADF